MHFRTTRIISDRFSIGTLQSPEPLEYVKHQNNGVFKCVVLVSVFSVKEI